jgi:DNA-binding LacI/PurR family transcriptional regulator
MALSHRARRENGGHVTIEDVARMAGVSRATASRVVNHNPHVGQPAQAAVLRAVEELGYVPNRAARSLMTRRTESIGVVILEESVRLFGDPFFGHLLVGISDGLSEGGLQLVLLMAHSEPEEARVERYLDAGHVDGAILVGPHGTDPLPTRLARAGVPVVLSGRPLHAAPVSYVDVDNRAGARMAVDHLVGRGRRRIATIHGTLDLSSAQDRLDGYRDGLAAAGIPADRSLEAPGNFNTTDAAAAMRRLLERHPDLDAVFAASDSMAAAAIGAIRDSGRLVPSDVAVVGFDDTQVALTTRPTLTTVRQPIEAMGREMARLLMRRIDRGADAPSQVVFQTELVVRESSGGA